METANTFYNVFWCPTYQESEPLFGYFTNHGCIFGRNPDRPLRHAFFMRRYAIFMCSFVLDYLLICSYNKTMKIGFDPVKSEQNTRLRALSFDRAGDFNWEIRYHEDETADR